MSAPPPLPSEQSKNNRPLLRLLGLVFVLPALLLALCTLWVPVIQLLQTAVQSGGKESGNWIGFLGFTGAVATVRSLACVIPIVLGVGVAFFGPLGRNLFRTCFLIPALMLGPLSFGFSCFLFLYNRSSSPWDRTTAPFYVLAGEGLLAGSILSIIALWLFPATRRTNHDDRAQSTRARLVLALFLLLAALASGLQALALPLSMTYGGPEKATTTLALHAYEVGLMPDSAQPAARLMLLLFLLVGVIGLASGVLLLVTDFRMDFGQNQTEPHPIGLSIGIVSGLVAFLLVAFPIALLLAGIFETGERTGLLDLRLALSKSSTFKNAIGPESLMIVSWLAIVVPTSYLAAFGIGALRPLGRFSEWLLLPFFPFFFVSIASLWPSFYQIIASFHLFGNPVSLLYPFLVPVPLLAYLTFFFKGQTARWRSANPRPHFLQAVILPSLPVTLTLAVATILFVLRDSLWYMLSPTTLQTPAQLLMNTLETFDMSFLRITLLLYMVGTVLLFFPILALLQIFVVDRLRIRVGRPS